MKYYLVDEISPSDIANIRRFLKEKAMGSEIEDLFWLEMPTDHLNEKQSAHQDCRPHRFAIELGTNWMKAELFIRTLNSLACECSDYCDSKQRGFIFDFMESMIYELKIRT